MLLFYLLTKNTTLLSISIRIDSLYEYLNEKHIFIASANWGSKQQEINNFDNKKLYTNAIMNKTDVMFGVLKMFSPATQK